jgi:hypothetical protein
MQMAAMHRLQLLRARYHRPASVPVPIRKQMMAATGAMPSGPLLHRPWLRAAGWWPPASSRWTTTWTTALLPTA